MSNSVQPTILGADRLSDSLIISFSDGRSGRYSAALLYTMLASATELFATELDLEDVEVEQPV